MNTGPGAQRVGRLVTDFGRARLSEVDLLSSSRTQWLLGQLVTETLMPGVLTTG